MKVKPGDKFTKNNVEITVHHVDASQVYGVRYKLPVDERAYREAMDNGQRPPSCLGAFRMHKAAFERAVTP